MDEKRLLLPGKHLEDGCSQQQVSGKYIPPHMRVAQPSSEIPPTNQRWKDRPQGSSMHFGRGRDWGCRPTPNGSSRQSAFQCEADESYWQREESRVFGDAKAAGSAIQSYDLP